MTKSTISKSEVNFAEKGYSQVQLIAVLMAGVTISILLDNIPLNKGTSKISHIGNLALVIMFVVFSINVLIAGSTSVHIFYIFNILAQSGKTAKMAWDLHKRTMPIMKMLVYLFWISLPLFLFSITIITIIRYKLIDNYYIYVYILLFILFVLFFSWFISYHMRLTKKYKVYFNETKLLKI